MWTRIEHDGGMCLGMFRHRFRPDSIFKIVDGDADSYIHYAKWLYETKPDNPHFPIIRSIEKIPKFVNDYGDDVIEGDAFYFVEVELLQKMSMAEAINASRGLNNVLRGKRDPNCPIEDACSILHDVFPHLRDHSDVHTSNVMKRANGQVVIIDPYSYEH